MYSARATSTFLDVGFPIRRSTGRRLLTAHRRLSQFCHALHRLLVPRHPPNALTSLTTTNLLHPSRGAPAADQVHVYCSPSTRSQRAGFWFLTPSRAVPRAMLIPSTHYFFLRARTSFIYEIVRSSVEDKGIEPSTLGLQSRCSPS